jgi:hypothetical protein
MFDRVACSIGCVYGSCLCDVYVVVGNRDRGFVNRDSGKGRVRKDCGAEGFSCRFMSQLFVLSYGATGKEGQFGEPSAGGTLTS